MSWFNRNKGATAEGVGSQENVNYEAKAMEMLNNAKFMESLDKNPNFNPDDIDVNDAESIKNLETQFEAFKLAGETQRDTEKLFKDEVSKALGYNAKPEDYEAIGKYFEELLNEDPEKIKEISGLLKEYTQAQKELQKYEEEFKKLETKETLQKKHDLALELKDEKFRVRISNWFSGEGKIKREEAKNSYKIDVENIKVDFENIKEALAHQEKVSDKVDELKYKINSLKTRLFNQVDSEGKVAEIMVKKSMEQIKDKVTKFNPRNADKRTMDEMIKASKNLDNLDYFDGAGRDSHFALYADQRELSDMLDQIDKKLEKGFDKQIMDAVANLDRMPTYKKLEDGLKPLLEASKIGKMEGDEVKTFVFTKLEKIKSDKKTSASKSLLISAFMKKQGAN